MKIFFLQLADAITDHIRFEERKLFPFIEKELAPEKLKAIENLSGDKKQCAIWQDEFWVKEKSQ